MTAVDCLTTYGTQARRIVLFRARHGADILERFRESGRTSVICAMGPEPELWVLTRVIDGSDSDWDESVTIAGTPERIRSMFDLSRGVPFGWRLLKGKKAERFLRDAAKWEARYQREQAAKEKFGGEN